MLQLPIYEEASSMSSRILEKLNWHKVFFHDLISAALNQVIKIEENNKEPRDILLTYRGASLKAPT